MNKITNTILKWQTKRFTKGLCFSMLVSFNAFMEKYPGKKFYSDYAKLALASRPGWKSIDEDTFVHKTGKKIKIETSHSLKDVIKQVCDVEMNNNLENLLPPEKAIYLQIAQNEIDKRFKQKK